MIDLVVFLGNPGREYESTRHNFARRVCASLPDAGELVWKEKFSGHIADLRRPGGICRCLMPMTFMNLSGRSVAAAAAFYRLAPDRILVVHDDIELPFGQVLWRIGGGLAGHNGLRSIREHLGTADFPRFRLGIGRPAAGSVSSWVLSRFEPDEERLIPEILTVSSGRLMEILMEEDHANLQSGKLVICP